MMFNSILLGMTAWPHGRYTSHVNPIMLPSQRISISVTGRNEGTLSLQGVVNLQDNFSFDVQKDGTLDLRLSADILKMLKLFHCVIAFAEYDFKEDYARLTLKMPFVKDMNIVMRK